MVQTVADYAALKQVAGDEQGPRQLARVAMASVKGTKFQSSLSTPRQCQYFLKRVREISFISTACRQAVDDRRWQYLTNTNLATWFVGYVSNLVTHGFLPESARYMDLSKEELKICAAILARTCNGDESHQKLSNEGDKAGPRASVYFNAELGRAGKRAFTHQKHATVLAWMNYNGEAALPHIMLATDAAAAKKGKVSSGEESDIRVRLEWTWGVPRVKGFFGHATEQTFEPSFIMNEKGGMEGGGLDSFLQMQVYPAYPNLDPEWSFNEDGSVARGPVFFQLDAGPDRYTECSVESRILSYQRGLILFPGLPNGTAANQVMDDLFGVYKGACNNVMDDIVVDRIAANLLDPSVKVLPALPRPHM